jgi:CHAT domain-containing protein
LSTTCDWLDHVPRPEPRRRAPASRALVVDVSLELDGNEPLPQARAEADAVTIQLRSAGLQVVRLSDTDATLPAMTAALMATELAHVACHGAFGLGDLTATGLILSPGVPDGLLDLRRIADMPLASLRHITLASCWSADNYLLPGRAVVSLPQALRHAGVGSVLSCLWKVDDLVSRTFSTRYYALCRTLSPPNALRKTQVELLDGSLLVGGVRATDPYFWAGFVAHCTPFASRIPLLGR